MKKIVAVEPKLAGVELIRAKGIEWFHTKLQDIECSENFDKILFFT